MSGRAPWYEKRISALASLLAVLVAVECRWPIACETPIEVGNVLPEPLPGPDMKEGKLVRDGDAKAEQEDRGLLAQQYGGRITWAFLLVLYLFLCIAAFAVAIGIR